MKINHNQTMMKYMKTLFSLYFTALSLQLWSSNSFAQLQFSTTVIAPVKVHGLQRWKGNYLTVYYAAHVVTSTIVNTDPNLLNLTVVRAKHESIPITKDVLDLPSVSFQKINMDRIMAEANLFPTYTMVVFVIHSQPEFTWINMGMKADNVIPIGLSNKGPATYAKLATSVVRRTEVVLQGAEFKDKLPSDPNLKPLLQVNLSGAPILQQSVVIFNDWF